MSTAQRAKYVSRCLQCSNPIVEPFDRCEICDGDGAAARYYVKKAPFQFSLLEEAREAWTVGFNLVGFGFQPRCDHESEADAERCAARQNAMARPAQRRVA